MKDLTELTFLYYGSGLVNKVKSVIAGFVLHYIFTFISIILILFTDKVLLPLVNLDSILTTHQQSSSLLEEYGDIIGLIIITQAGPLIEEIMFRLILKPTKINIIISSITFYFFVSGPVWYLNYFPFLRFFICLFLSVFLFIFNDYLRGNLQKINQKKFLISTAIGFSLLHIYNFSNIQYILLPLYFIYVLPQFFLGIILGIIRLKNGLIWSVVLHVLVNGSVTWPKVFTNG